MHKEDFIYGEEKNCYVGINRSSIIDNVFRTCIGSRKCSSYRYSSISANYRPLMGKYKNRCAVNFDFWQTDFRISIFTFVFCMFLLSLNLLLTFLIFDVRAPFTEQYQRLVPNAGTFGYTLYQISPLLMAVVYSFFNSLALALFAVFALAIQMIVKFNNQYVAIVILGSDSDYIYLLVRPSDVQFLENDDTSLKQYKQLQQESQVVLAGFLKDNSITVNEDCPNSSCYKVAHGANK